MPTIKHRARRAARRHVRYAIVLLAVALVAVVARTALLPRLAFAQHAALERAVVERTRAYGFRDKIRHSKAHVSGGKGRHLAFAPLDSDDDGDDDGDDDCLAVDEIHHAAPPPPLLLPSVYAIAAIEIPSLSSIDSVNARAHGARAPPRLLSVD